MNLPTFESHPELQSWYTIVMIRIPLLLSQLGRFMVDEYRIHLIQPTPDAPQPVSTMALLPGVSSIETPKEFSSPQPISHYTLMTVAFYITLASHLTPVVFTTFLGLYGDGPPSIIGQ